MYNANGKKREYIWHLHINMKNYYVKKVSENRLFLARTVTLVSNSDRKFNKDYPEQ